MTHRFVMGGIGLHLGAIECHMAQAHHANFLAEPQDLHKQAAQSIEFLAPEFTNTAVVRLLIAGQHTEPQTQCDIINYRFLDRS
jgi:hypothetical protein